MDEKKKKKDAAAEKREGLAQAILTGDNTYYNYRVARRRHGYHVDDGHEKLLELLDPR